MGIIEKADRLAQDMERGRVTWAQVSKWLASLTREEQRQVDGMFRDITPTPGISKRMTRNMQ